MDLTPSLPDNNNSRLVYKCISHYYYDNEAYHIAQPVVTKSQAVAQLEHVFALSKSIFGAKTIMFRSDLEASLGNKSSEASKILRDLGVKRMPSAAYTPAQNGAAEAAGKAISIKARSLSTEAGLPTNIWLWLIQAAVYLLNRTPTAKLQMKTPFEAVTGKKPYIGHLHPIGCKAFELNKNLAKRHKLESRAHVGYYLGYADSTNIYFVWIPSISKVIRTRDVFFKDNELFNSLKIDNLTLGETISSVDHQVIIQRIELPEDIYVSKTHQTPVSASKVQSGKSKRYNLGK